MTTPVYTYKTPVQRTIPVTRQFPSILAVTVLLISLITTGCDVVDSNVPTEPETISADARYALGTQPPRWITPIDDPVVSQPLQQIEWPAFVKEAAWPASELIGTWELTTADVQTLPEGSIRPQITFRNDGIFTGYAECYSFSGRYSVGSDRRLTITDVRANHKFCVQENDPIREALFAGLQEATDFRFEHSTLWIMSWGGKRGRLFIFERMEKDTEAEAIVEGVDTIGMPPAASQ